MNIQLFGDSMFDKLQIKIRNWRMERIPEIERPACIHCKQDMYWNRDKQDWSCKPCDDYNRYEQDLYDYGDHDDPNFDHSYL